MADMHDLKVGVTHKMSKQVTKADSAKKYGSGTVDVYATPAMIALMESTCMNAVAPFLAKGFGTVGTGVNITHSKATSVGQTVTCIAKLASIDGRKLNFEVSASDEMGIIGAGTHTRFIVDLEKFLQKLDG